MELEERIGRGIRANEVLQNETYTEAYELLKQEILTKWQESPARDVEGREKLFLMMGLVDKIKSLMESTMIDGKVASKELERRKTILEQAQDFARDIW